MIDLSSYAAAHAQRALSVTPVSSDTALENELALALRAAGVSAEDTRRYLAGDAAGATPRRHAA